MLILESLDDLLAKRKGVRDAYLNITGKRLIISKSKEHLGYTKLKSSIDEITHQILSESFLRDFFCKDKLSFQPVTIEIIDLYIEAGIKNPNKESESDSPKDVMTFTPPAIFIGRDEDLKLLRQKILANRTTIIQGWPGIGKTSIVNTLGIQNIIRDEFSDGVIFLTAGNESSAFSLLLSISRFYNLNSDLTQGALSEITGRLLNALKGKEVLIIIDDVWETTQVVPILKLLPHDGKLCITTRLPQICIELALPEECIFLIKGLDEYSATQLFSIIAPEVIRKYKNESRKLLRDIEFLPLAIHVAGRLLNEVLRLGFELEDLFTEIEIGAILLQAKAPADRMDFENETLPTVGSLLHRSIDRLDETTKRHFASLAPFAPKPASFDLEILKKIWQVDNPKPILKKLIAIGLLEPIGERFQMHALFIQLALSLLE